MGSERSGKDWFCLNRGLVLDFCCDLLGGGKGVGGSLVRWLLVLCCAVAKYE